MTVWVDESGVRFGPFAQDDIFRIERSSGIAALGENIRKVEFAVRMTTRTGNRKTAFIEAKSTIPKDTDAFYAKVRDKMLHSLTLWIMALMGKHPCIRDELPIALGNPAFIHDQIDLILIIPQMPDTHLSAATDKFRTLMMGDIRTWGILPNNVRVLNEAKARLYGVIAGAAHR